MASRCTCGITVHTHRQDRAERGMSGHAMSCERQMSACVRARVTPGLLPRLRCSPHVTRATAEHSRLAHVGMARGEGRQIHMSAPSPHMILPALTMATSGQPAHQRTELNSACPVAWTRSAGCTMTQCDATGPEVRRPRNRRALSLSAKAPSPSPTRSAIPPVAWRFISDDSRGDLNVPHVAELPKFLRSSRVLKDHFVDFERVDLTRLEAFDG